jgi:hypothetical protein
MSSFQLSQHAKPQFVIIPFSDIYGLILPGRCSVMVEVLCLLRLATGHFQRIENAS